MLGSPAARRVWHHQFTGGAQLNADPLGCACDDGGGSWKTMDNGGKLPMMAASTIRERIVEAMRSLPADATFDDAIERLVFLARIEEGLAQLDAGQGIPHEDLKRRLGV